MEYDAKRDIAERLVAELEDELEGICKYDCFHKMLVEYGMEDEAKVIERIASDEWRHADKLWRMLDNFEIEIPKKIHELWDKVDEIFE